jgi:phenylacetate-CoA ligase
MCTVPPQTRAIDYVTTGGTSGRPLQFYIDASRSPLEFAYLISGWERGGYRLGTPLAVLRGRAVAATRSGLHHEYDRALRQHFYSSFHLNDDELPRVMAHLRGIGPCFLHVYPSSAAALARYIQRSGTEAPGNVLGVLAESEILYPDQRTLVEAVFGRRVFASYGLTEKVAAATECEWSNDYHVWPTYGYVELLKEGGAPVTAPGERGEIVATGFMNTVVPFIRYRTGDEATYVGERCQACGREHMVISDIRGHRVQELLIAGDGSEISWTALNMHDDTFDRVVRFQFYQEEPGRAVLRLVPAAGFGASDRARIQERLSKKIDGRIAVALELVDEVALSTAGKAIYVDQRIPAARLVRESRAHAATA